MCINVAQNSLIVRHTSRNPQFLVVHAYIHISLQGGLSLFTGVLVWRFCPGVFCLEGFVRGGFCPSPLLSEYIRYNRKLNITFNFRFHMYEQILKSVTSHALGPPPHCHKLSHLLGPPPPSSVTYFMDGPLLISLQCETQIF